MIPACSRSRGLEVVRFAAKYGITLDHWQADALRAFSGVTGSPRRWTSTTNVLLCPRQNGKSEVLIARALYGLFGLRRKMILFSSHQWASSNESFLRLKAVIEENDELAEQVKHTRLSAAQLGFELVSGGRILFLTRSRAAARGFSGDELYFDEAHFLSEAAHAAIRPTLGGRSAEGVQVYYAASAPDQERHPDALVLTRLRQRALSGEQGIALVEYAAGIVDEEGRELLPSLVPAAVAVDEDVIRRSNPACPERLALEFLLDEARTLDPTSYAVEHLGQGDWPSLDGAASTVVDLEKWAAGRDPDSKPTMPVCVGFDVSPDRRRASIAIAGVRPDGAMHLELTDAAEGVGWVVPRLKQFIEDHDPDSVVCDQAQALLAGSLYDDGGPKAVTLDRATLAQACASLVDLVEQGELRHLGDPLLVDAIKGAMTVPAGDAGWVFSRRSSRVDISPLYAAVLALWGARELPGETAFVLW